MNLHPHPTSHLPPPLRQSLRAAEGRLRLITALRLSSRGLVASLVLTLLLLWLGRLVPLAHPLLLLGIGLGLTLLILFSTVAFALLRPHPPQAIARQLDRRLHLDERLTTALDLAVDRRDTPPAIVAAQLADTLHHLRGLEVARVFPVRLPWPWLGISVALSAAILVSWWLPNPQLERLQQQAETQALIEKQAAQLEEIRADLLANEALLETPAGLETRQTLDNLIEALQDSQLRPEEALASLAEAEQALAELQQAAAQQEQSLDALAQTFSQFPATAELAQALQRREMAEAGQFLQSAAANLGQSAPSEQAQLAEALQQAADAAQAAGDSELAESLAEAAEALQQNLNAQGSGGSEQQASQEALEQAAEALANAEQNLGNQEALQEALGNIQEAQEQLAQAAGEGGQQPGQPQAGSDQSGQSPGQGQEPGSGQEPGQGQGSGAGRGEGGDPTQDLFADSPGQAAETDNGPNQGLQGAYDAKYPPIHWGGDGGPLVNPDQQGAEGGLPIGEAPLDPNQPPGPAQVPYNQVYGQYADAAGEALEDTYIPLGMKEVVRNYFGALEPGSE